MTQLTTEQLAYLNHHKIDLRRVFNAKGLPPREYRVIMKDLNKAVAFNVNPCKKNGHTLRSRSGHCIQCNPAGIAFQNRADLEGIIYVAGSTKGRLLKVGFSKSLLIREGSLNRTNYANQTDWVLLYVLKSDLAGRVELEIHKLIKKFRVQVEYDHDGHYQVSNETFRLNYTHLKRQILDVIDKVDPLYEVVKENDYSKFENIKDGVDIVNLSKIKSSKVLFPDKKVKSEVKVPEDLLSDNKVESKVKVPKDLLSDNKVRSEVKAPQDLLLDNKVKSEAKVPEDLLKNNYQEDNRNCKFRKNYFRRICHSVTALFKTSYQEHDVSVPLMQTFRDSPVRFIYHSLSILICINISALFSLGDLEWYGRVMMLIIPVLANPCWSHVDHFNLSAKTVDRLTDLFLVYQAIIIFVTIKYF